MLSVLINTLHEKKYPVNWKIKRSLPLSNRQLSPQVQILISLLRFAKRAVYALYGAAELLFRTVFGVVEVTYFVLVSFALIAFQELETVSLAHFFFSCSLNTVKMEILFGVFDTGVL